jgi:Cu-Zn family superoxide dismutase
MSAKGHFNPTGAPHGDPMGGAHHAGDLPALKADAKGVAKLDTTVSGISVAAGATSIVGRGLIVHADPDDYKTQPTGNSGARLACGVIQPG